MQLKRVFNKRWPRRATMPESMVEAWNALRDGMAADVPDEIGENFLTRGCCELVEAEEGVTDDDS